MKKYIISIAVLALITVCLVPLTQKIDRVLEGVEYRIGDSTYEEHRRIEIRGQYRRYLLKNNTFEGEITIEGYDFSDKSPKVMFEVHDGYASFTYFGMEGVAPYLNTLGTISFANNFKQVLICVSEPIEAGSKTWSSENGLFIVAPTTNREEALVLAKKLSQKTEWMAKIDWK